MGEEDLKEPQTPKAWAARLTQVLNLASAAHGSARFPVDVATLAVDYTTATCGTDHIAFVEGKALNGLEGCLLPLGAPDKRWGIVFNLKATAGRQRFTIAHELGHFLLHRRLVDDGFSCSVRDVAGGADSARSMEREADEFAAWLLMPLDDFRQQIDPQVRPNLDDLSAAAKRYGTSLVATALRWVSYTMVPAIVAVSRDGFVLFARSSDAAMKAGLFLPTRRHTIECPPGSLAASDDPGTDGRDGIRHGPEVWCQVPSREFAIRSDNFDMTLSVVFLDDVPRWERER